MRWQTSSRDSSTGSRPSSFRLHALLDKLCASLSPSSSAYFEERSGSLAWPAPGGERPFLAWPESHFSVDKSEIAGANGSVPTVAGVARTARIARQLGRCRGPSVPVASHPLAMSRRPPATATSSSQPSAAIVTPLLWNRRGLIHRARTARTSGRCSVLTAHDTGPGRNPIRRGR